MPIVPSNYYNPPQAQSPFDPYNPFTYNVGGGLDQANMNLQAAQLAQAGELGRRQFGSNLLNQLFSLQQNPFSIVPALQAYGASGGGVLAPATAFAQTGGAGAPSPYGGLVDRLLSDLAGFAVTRGSEAPPAASYERGTPYVPRTGTYKLHKGEAVTPANEGGRKGLGMMDVGRRMRQMRQTNVMEAMKHMMMARDAMMGMMPSEKGEKRGRKA